MRNPPVCCPPLLFCARARYLSTKSVQKSTTVQRLQTWDEFSVSVVLGLSSRRLLGSRKEGRLTARAVEAAGSEDRRRRGEPGRDGMGSCFRSSFPFQMPSHVSPSLYLRTREVALHQRILELRALGRSSNAEAQGRRIEVVRPRVQPMARQGRENERSGE